MSSPCGTSSRVRIDGIDDGSRTVDLDFLSEAMRRLHVYTVVTRVCMCIQL